MATVYDLLVVSSVMVEVAELKRCDKGARQTPGDSEVKKPKLGLEAEAHESASNKLLRGLQDSIRCMLRTRFVLSTREVDRNSRVESFEWRELNFSK